MFLDSPLFSPPLRPLQVSIPASQLSVNVFGPPVASLGSPVGSGELYTAVIRNASTSTAYSSFLTATIQPFFVHDSGDQLLNALGAIPITVTTGSGVITWTPVTTLNLGVGETITLNFRLRATCGAQSGQQMRVGIRYNADPAQPPIELNDSGLNITTGRGNLVIKKEPAIQNLGTLDFGKPVTWTVTVQNTGLGKLYGAGITDTGGISLSQPSGGLVPTATIPVLDVNQSMSFTVVGTVEACNFTNVALGAWTCGNQVGDATATNPVSSTASVLFTPEIPRVSIQVASPITFPYCSPLTRTVNVTLTNTGGPAKNFRVDSTLESDSFLEVITSSLSSGWAYNAMTGIFSYTTGTPTGTLPANSVVTLTFDVRPGANVCTAGSGSVAFTPQYNDICSNEPFTANPATLDYQYAQGEAPTLSISKSGPSIVSSGEVFSYQITVSGQNPRNISGSIFITDVLPPQFVILGPISPSAGITATTGQTVTWQFDPPDAPDTFTETLTYRVRAVDTLLSCNASQIVANNARAAAEPTCPGCALLNAADQVDTAIENSEGIFSDHSASGSTEACGSGLTLASSFVITGSTIVTWTGAVFTDALGTALGAGALPPGAAPLIYAPGSLSVTVGITDYSSLLIPIVNPSGQLVIDLGPLQAAGAPTQNVTLRITYTAAITEGSLNGAVEQAFYNWSQLFLPNTGSSQACAANQAYNQALPLTIGRGDLSVSLAPQVLDRCRTNRATINVTDNAPGRLTSNVVVTFTSSVAEIQSARNFTFTGSLASVGAISVVTDTAIGGGRGVSTFTLPTGADLDGDGAILFDIDVNCTESADWNAGITFLSRCALPHGHTTSLGHVYRAPNLILFATPIQYTVREKDVIWKFFVANNGNLTATNVVITNAINGIAVLSYTTNSGVGSFSISGTLPISSPPASGVVWTLSELAPNELREVAVYGRVFQCLPLRVDISAGLECFGSVCRLLQARVDFNTPDPYLLTNNGQTADLPMCDLGNVVFTTKNASPDVSLYQLNITETLVALAPDYAQPFTLTILDSGGGVITTTTEFTPQITAFPTQTLLSWKAISAPAGIFDALGPLSVVVITVPVRTSCVPPNAPQSFASASAQGPCGKQLGYSENAVTLQTKQPNLRITKDGRGPTGAFGDTVYASPGDAVTWRITVDNLPTDHAYVAHNVVLSDTWPFNFQFITATAASPAFTMTVLTASNTVTWHIGDIAVGDSLQFLITGTVAITSDACQLQTINTSRLSFGCGDGCLSAIVPQDTARLTTGPDLRVILSPGTLQTCEGDIPITIRNLGSTAYSTTLTLTLPPGYSYSQTIGVSLTPTQIITSSSSPQFFWDNIPGQIGSTPYEFTMTIRVRNAAASGACAVPNGLPVTATLEYDNHPVCTAAGPFTATTSANLTVQTPSFVMTKSPRTATVDAGQRITWTLRLTNTGPGIAERVVVTDVMGSNYDPATIVPGNGSDGAMPVIAGNIITWTPGNIASGGVWTATASVVLLSTGDNRNIITATAGCASGCQTASATNTAFTTLLQQFAKNPQVQTGTIGSLVVFTFSTFLNDSDALYQRLTLTDRLPVGLGYVASYVTATHDTDGGQGGPFAIISGTPTISPALFASGNVVWQLGDLSGTVSINGVITAVIQNVASNFDGLRLTNVLSMTYTDDGQPYVYTDTADVDIQEPVLHLGKSYVTSYGCTATLFADNFNTGGAPIPPWINPGGAGWSIVGGAAQNNANAANRRIYNGDTAWSDYSFSAMIRSTDTNGDIGLIFRSQAADGNYYRFVWNRGGTNNYRLQRVVGGAATDIGAAAGSAYEVSRWYHVEIRAEGSRLRVYIDGALALDRTDAQWSTGRIGLYANNQSVASFDDALVTRLNRAGCTVGAGDLVTYTLVVSNQNRLTGYDLVITDALPGGMSLVSYTLASDDPVSAFTFEPSPVPGATGVLTWGVNQLTATQPFVATTHRALTLTVVLQVSPGITANTVLANQAFLAYDAWSGSPIATTRGYSGGSHSAAVRTLPPLIVKSVTPPTATLGTVVTYTILFPSPPITAALYNVSVTDPIDPRLQIHVIDAAPDGAVTRLGNAFTVTYPIISPNDQRAITITTVLSDPLGAVAGNVITNAATLSHTTDITLSNPVTFTVVEPGLNISKTVLPPRRPVGAGDTVTYTLMLNNAGTSPAFDVTLTDTLPPGVAFLATQLFTVSRPPTATLGGDYPAWTASEIDVGAWLTVTFTARVSDAIGSGLTLTNTTRGMYSSRPGVIDGERAYTTPIPTAPISTGLALIDVEKFSDPTVMTAGLPLTFTLVVTNIGIVSATGVLITDRLPTGVAFVDATPPFIGPDAGRVITWPIGTLDVGASRVVTLLVDVSAAYTGTTIANTGWVTDTEGLTDTDTITVPLGTAANLRIVKTDDPDPVVSGQLLTYTLVASNDGPADAQNVVVSDTLPPEVTFNFAAPPQSSGPNPLAWNLGTLTAGSSVTFTVVVTVNPSALGVFTNTVAITSTTPDSNPPDDTDDERTDQLTPTLEIEKRVTPGEVVRNQPLSYTLRITNTGQITFNPLLVTDTLPSVDFHYQPGSGSPSDPDLIAEPLLRWNNLGPLAPGQTLTVTFAVTASPGLTGTYFNIADVEGDTPGGVITDTDDVPISLQDPRVTVDKQVADIDLNTTPPSLVTFTIHITNVGPSVIDVLPLLDFYDPAYLSFVSAAPAPDDTIDDGQITWADLTAPPPNGFNADLPLSQSFHITTVFSVVQDIITTTNTAVVSDSTDIFDNPANDDDDSEILNDVPTAVELLYFRVKSIQGQQVSLAWATAVEVDNFGFNLYRGASDDFSRAEWIHFEPSAVKGNGVEATYVYADSVPTDGVWWYWLADFDTQGRETVHPPVSAVVQTDALWPRHVYLPIVVK